LARRLCPNCKKKRQANQSEMAEISRVVENLNLRGEQIEFDGMVYEACGCSECSNIGYKGQMLIAEVLYITDEIRQMVYSSPTSKDILDVAHRNGMRDMWEEGVCRVIRGDSTIDEIARNIERQY
jgi:type II secretory ATPase GspE/PulE/Tfp pilus assembly ATPase PilB-like protein